MNETASACVSRLKKTQDENATKGNIWNKANRCPRTLLLSCSLFCCAFSFVEQSPVFFRIRCMSLGFVELFQGVCLSAICLGVGDRRVDNSIPFLRIICMSPGSNGSWSKTQIFLAPELRWTTMHQWTSEQSLASFRWPRSSTLHALSKIFVFLMTAVLSACLMSTGLVSEDLSGRDHLM